MKDEVPDRHHAGVAQLVEHQPSKLNVAGSSLVSRSTPFTTRRYRVMEVNTGP